MKTKRKVLIGVMALALAGGVSTAFALSADVKASDVTQSGAIDSAIVLGWNSTGVTEGHLAAANPVVGTNVYRYLGVEEQSTKTVAGTVTVSFQTESAANYGLSGLTVKVYNAGTSGMASDETRASLMAAENSLLATVTGQAGSTSAATQSTAQSVAFSVTAGEAKHPTNHYYILEFIYDGTQQGSGITFGGGLKISQAFAAS